MRSKKSKDALAWIIAIIAGFFAVKGFFVLLGWSLKIVFSLVFLIVFLVMLAAAVLPLYVIIRKKFIR